MGLLALDIASFGVVMSADSQRVELLDGANNVLGPPHTKHIFPRRGGGFAGLVGYVGTEMIATAQTRTWLETYSSARPSEPLPDFCRGLADTLTTVWKAESLDSVLWIFVSGVEGSEVRFWYVDNTHGLYDNDWSYKKPSRTFKAVDDLDGQKLPPLLAAGQTKEQVLQARLFFFRNGVMLKPAALILDSFTAIIESIYLQGIPGFARIASLEDLAFFDRQRMEFTKRVFSTKKGIYSIDPPPIDGTVHVLGVARDGSMSEYHKNRGQVTTIP
jgi:hypothetical protein